MAKKCETSPNILYHYTSIEAFKKIIESGKIHATRYDQMNDESEIQIGVEKLLEFVRKHEVDDSFRDYKNFLISGIEAYKDDILEVYVLSLSRAADSLDQWRAYARSGGVAIGFDKKKVQEGFLCNATPKVSRQQVQKVIRHDLKNRLMQCLYTDKNGDLDLRSIVADRFFKQNS